MLNAVPSDSAAFIDPRLASMAFARRCPSSVRASQQNHRHVFSSSKVSIYTSRAQFEQAIGY
jgi:hypothetical protein